MPGSGKMKAALKPDYLNGDEEKLKRAKVSVNLQMLTKEDWTKNWAELRERRFSFKGACEMIISHRHKIIFIHILKTAGSTMRALLEPVSDDMNDFLNDAGKKFVSDRIVNGLNGTPPHINISGL